MAAVAPQAVIGDQRITLHPNAKNPRSWYQIITDFSDTAGGGPFRILQLGQRICDVADQITPSQDVKNMSKMFRQGWTATIIPRLFGATKDAKEALMNARQPARDAETSQRRAVKTIFDVTDGVAAWGYAGVMILGCIQKTAAMSLRALKFSDAVTFVHDLTDGQMNSQDWNKARLLANRVERMGDGAAIKEIHSNLVQTQRYHLLKTLKAVCSVAGFMLGLSLLMAAIAPSSLSIALVAACISLFSTAFAMTASLYEESMKYERVKFFDERHVQKLPVRVAGG